MIFLPSLLLIIFFQRQPKIFEEQSIKIPLINYSQILQIYISFHFLYLTRCSLSLSLTFPIPKMLLKNYHIQSFTSYFSMNDLKSTIFVIVTSLIGWFPLLIDVDVSFFLPFPIPNQTLFPLTPPDPNLLLFLYFYLQFRWKERVYFGNLKETNLPGKMFIMLILRQRREKWLFGNSSLFKDTFGRRISN